MNTQQEFTLKEVNILFSCRKQYTKLPPSFPTFPALCFVHSNKASFNLPEALCQENTFKEKRPLKKLKANTASEWPKEEISTIKLPRWILIGQEKVWDSNCLMNISLLGLHRCLV